jgi:hypothetical protein
MKSRIKNILIASALLSLLPCSVSLAQPVPCLFLLEPTSTALSINGNASIVADCSIFSVSSSSESLSQTGNSAVSAVSIGTVGTVRGNNYTPPPATGLNPAFDPLFTLQPPSPASCIPKVKIVSGTTTLPPGTYCGGVSISGASTNVTLLPGPYIFKGGDLTISGDAIVSGDGLILFFTTDGKKYAGFGISGVRTSVTLAPSTVEQFSGVTIFQDRATPNNFINYVAGGNVSVAGTIYTPSTALAVSGEASVSTSAIIARELRMGGSAELDITGF